jgi:60 kDa SS-A/Ro ribonucleoprotein
MMEEWGKYKKRNKAAKLICIDLTPRNNSQVSENKDILQIGGWSDQCFDIVAKFIENNEGSNDFWVKEIEKISLDSLTQDQSSSIIEMEAMDAS